MAGQQQQQQQQGKGKGKGKQTFGEANQRRDALGSTASGYDDELETTKAWESVQLEPASANTLTTTTDTFRNTSSPLHPGVFQPPPHSPLLTASDANLPSVDPEAAVSDDSDFDIIDPNTPSQLDGAPEITGRNYAYIPTAITERYAAQRRKRKQPKQPKQEHFDDDDEDWHAVTAEYTIAGPSRMEGGNDYDQPEWRQAGPHADAQDLAGPGEHGMLECTVTQPQKEGEGTQNAYVSYLVTTDTDFKSFQASHQTVRRRFTDFIFLYKTLVKEYPQCAVPPVPDKQNMSYVRGAGFSPDFMARRAHSLQRFLKRLTLHPVLRRSTILTLFLESNDWNATMRSRPTRGLSSSDGTSGGVLETWTDSFLNAFTKPHKADRRFTEVEDRAKKLDEDLATVSKTVARVAKRESDLETDYADLAQQFQKLSALEPGVTDELTRFATTLQDTSEGWKDLREHTDQSYLGSLKDMEAYGLSVKALLKTREQKQLDFEALTDYLTKAAQERDALASHGGSMGASGFLRQKIEDVRGVDHEQARRERQRRLEVQIQRLQTEVENAKKTSEAFDEEVVKEVGDFERIKAVEFRDALEGLADANVTFFENNVEIWEKFVKDLERLQEEKSGSRGEVTA
ncbi:hypothetical protein MBLNU13_g03957t1 [Cladosporium sp. NU13]